MNSITSLNLDDEAPSGASAASGYARLSGWRLAVARTVVLAISVVTVGLGIYALVLWPRLATPCENPAKTCLFTPEQAAAMSHLGVSPLELAFGVVLINCIAIALVNSVAVLLLWRRSDDAMALLVAVTLILAPAFFTPMYMPLTGFWHQVAAVVNYLGGLLFLLLLGVFPSGRFEPRWMWIPLLALVVAASGMLGRLSTAILLPIILVCLGCIIGGQVYRYRVISLPLQRQQSKWAVAGLIMAILVNQLFWQPAGWIPALERKDSLYPLLLYPDFALIIGIIAVTFGVAILRYRLYGIDVIIRQTLIYAMLTAILAALYFGIVVGVQSLTQRLTGASGQQPVVIVLTTLLVAALISPLRRRIQSGIDRAFFRSAFDATRTLRTFGDRMRMETNLAVLCDDFVEVVERTMQPERVSLWLRNDAIISSRSAERVSLLSKEQSQSAL